MSTLVSAVHRDSTHEFILTGRVACEGNTGPCTFCGHTIDPCEGHYVWHDSFGLTVCESCAAPLRITEPHVLGVDDV